MYATTASISASVRLAPKPGRERLPRATRLRCSLYEYLCPLPTRSGPKLPEPFCPWQAEHVSLYTASPKLNSTCEYFSSVGPLDAQSVLSPHARQHAHSSASDSRNPRTFISTATGVRRLRNTCSVFRSTCEKPTEHPVHEHESVLESASWSGQWCRSRLRISQFPPHLGGLASIQSVLR